MTTGRPVRMASPLGPCPSGAPSHRKRLCLDEAGGRPRDGPLADGAVGLLDADPHDGELESARHLVADELQDPFDRLVAEDLPFRLVEDAEDRLGPLAGRHVARPEDEGLRLSVGTAQDVRNGLDPDVPSVSNPVPVLRRAGFSGHRSARQLLADHLAVVGVDEVEGVRPEELSGRPARDELVRRADELESPREVHLADHVDHVVGQPLQIRLGRVEGLCRPRSFRHVPHDGHHGVRPVGNHARFEDPRARLDVERVLERLRRPREKAGVDLLHPERRRGGGQKLRDRAAEEGLLRQDQVLRARGVDLEVAPFPIENQNEVGKSRHDRPQLQLALAEGFLGAFSLDGLRDLGGDEDEEVAVFLGVADLARIALDRQDADRPFAAAQRNAEPVDRVAPDLLDLAGGDELLEDGGRREKRPARPENVLRQALAERASAETARPPRRRSTGSSDTSTVRVVQSDVEVGGLHQPAHDGVDPREQLLQALGRP